MIRSISILSFLVLFGLNQSKLFARDSEIHEPHGGSLQVNEEIEKYRAFLSCAQSEAGSCTHFNFIWVDQRIGLDIPFVLNRELINASNLEQKKLQLMITIGSNKTEKIFNFLSNRQMYGQSLKVSLSDLNSVRAVFLRRE